MRQPPRNAPLPKLRPENRAKLEPFLSTLNQVLMPRARRAGFRMAGKRTLATLTAGIDAALTNAIGHTIEPVIVFFAFRRCCQMYAAAISEGAPVSLQRRQFHLIDCAWRLIVELEQFDQVDVLLNLTCAL